MLASLFKPGSRAAPDVSPPKTLASPLDEPSPRSNAAMSGMRLDPVYFSTPDSPAKPGTERA
jgi:hypothetical protein